MATYSTYTNGEVIANYSGGQYAGSPVRTVISGVFDASRRNLASTNTVAVVNIPAGTWIEAVILEIVTPEATATTTTSVGDSGGTSSWVSAVDTTAAAGTRYLGAGAYAIATGTSQTNGKYYATATTLDILADTGKVATTLKVKVHVICTVM